MIHILNRVKGLLFWVVPSVAAVGIIALGMDSQINFDFPEVLNTIFVQMKSFFYPAQSIFLAILVQSFPFIMLGALVSSVIQEFVPSERMVSWIPRNRIAAVLVGGTIGLVVPTCDCGTIPIARSLLRKGMPRCAVTSYTLAAPVMNPVTIAATYVAFGFNLPMTILRMLFTYAIACTVGFITGLRNGPSWPLSLDRLETSSAKKKQLGAKLTAVECWRRLRHIVDHVVTEFFEIAGFLILSAAVASIYQVYHIQHGVFGRTHSGVFAVATMMGLGILFSLCSEADAFVARSFAVSYSPGSVLAFMLIGQMADLRNLFLLPKTFGLRHGIIIIGLCCLLCFVVGIIV